MGAKQTCVRECRTRLVSYEPHNILHRLTSSYVQSSSASLRLDYCSAARGGLSSSWGPVHGDSLPTSDGLRSPTICTRAHMCTHEYFCSVIPLHHSSLFAHTFPNLTLALTFSDANRSHLHVENVSQEQVSLDVLWGTESSRRVLAPMTNASIEGRPQGRVEATAK